MVSDEALKCPRLIPLVVQGHHQELIVEQAVHASPLKVDNLQHERFHHVRPGVRLVCLVCENSEIPHQFVPNRARYMVRVDFRLSALLLVWRAKGLVVSVDQERDSLLEPHLQ